MAKKITWWQAVEILGISDRHMRRWRERYVEEVYDGLLDRRRGKPSRRRVPVATVEKVFALYREKYFDLNVQHFQEKLQVEHGIGLSYTWVKQALQGAGLVARGRKRGHIGNGQVVRALHELGVQMIPAYSPEARGRSERNFSTWQGRLPQELRLRQIRTLEAANRFLREDYIAGFEPPFSGRAEASFWALPLRSAGCAGPQIHRETIFMEHWFGVQNGGIGGAGSRVFDVYCNGSTLLRGFDIFREAGSRPLVKTFRHVEPTAQGKIEVYFTPAVNYASISAIEVLPE